MKDNSKGRDIMDTLEWLSTLEIASACFAKTYTADQSQYPMHNHGRYADGLIYTISGNETFHFKDSTVTATPNSILFIPKGEEYTIALEKDAKSVVITIDFELHSMPVRPFLIDCGLHKTTAKMLFSEAEQAWKHPNAEQRVVSLAVLYQTVGIMIKQTKLFTEVDLSFRISPAVNYLHEHVFDSDFRVSVLSEMVGISDKYFETLFKDRYHMTPKSYLTFLRTEQAKRLLLNEKTSVAEVALQLGYCDVYHFSKIFTKKVGMSPVAYRKQNTLPERSADE